MMTAIRRNSLKRIESILNDAVLICERRYTARKGVRSSRASVERVLEVVREFRAEHVWVDQDGVLYVSIEKNWSFASYPSRGVAEKNLTPQSMEKYFGE